MAHIHPVTHRVDIDIDRASVHAGHVRRVATLDPMARVPNLELEPSDTVLVARAGDAAAIGRVRLERHDPDAEAALWGALRQHWLMPFAVGDDAEVAWDRLLNRWCSSLEEVAGARDLDSAAMVTVASQDTILTRPLVHHGFAPLVNLALRHRRVAPGSGVPPDVSPRDARVRLARDEDVEEMVEMAVALQRHDASFGMVTERPSAHATLRSSIASHRDRCPDWSWVVDASGGRLAGFVTVDPPEHTASWIAALATVEPVACLGNLFVRPAARRAGIGAALAATAHRALDAAGVATTLLHHAVPSALSAPFWARQGYRPLWTTWQRRPAVMIA